MFTRSEKIVLSLSIIIILIYFVLSVKDFYKEIKEKLSILT